MAARGYSLTEAHAFFHSSRLPLTENAGGTKKLGNVGAARVGAYRLGKALVEVFGDRGLYRMAEAQVEVVPSRAGPDNGGWLGHIGRELRPVSVYVERPNGSCVRLQATFCGEQVGAEVGFAAGEGFHFAATPASSG